MSSLFLPKEQRELSELIIEKRDRFMDEFSLICVEGSCIYYLSDFSSKPVLLRDRRYNVHNVGLNKKWGYLYDCGEYGLVRTYDNQPVVDRNYNVYAVLDFVGDGLYFSHNEGYISKYYKDNRAHLMAQREGIVRSLCEHDGVMYDAGDDWKIWDTLDNRVVAERPGSVNSLLSFRPGIFDAGDYSRIFDTFTSKDYGALPPGCGNISSIFNMEVEDSTGLFYHNIEQGIFNLMTDEHTYGFDGRFSVVMPVKKSVVTEILQNE